MSDNQVNFVSPNFRSYLFHVRIKLYYFLILPRKKFHVKKLCFTYSGLKLLHDVHGDFTSGALGGSSTDRIPDNNFWQIIELLAVLP